MLEKYDQSHPKFMYTSLPMLNPKHWVNFLFWYCQRLGWAEVAMCRWVLRTIGCSFLTWTQVKLFFFFLTWSILECPLPSLCPILTVVSLPGVFYIKWRVDCDWGYHRQDSVCSSGTPVVNADSGRSDIGCVHRDVVGWACFFFFFWGAYVLKCCLLYPLKCWEITLLWPTAQR